MPSSVGVLAAVLHFVKLDLAADGLHLGAGGVLAGVLAGAGELRDDDGGQDAEDDHDDQDLDEREAASAGRAKGAAAEGGEGGVGVRLQGRLLWDAEVRLPRDVPREGVIALAAALRFRLRRGGRT